MSWARVAIFWICMFSIVFNCSQGIMLVAFPDFATHSSYTAGLSYHAGYESGFVNVNNKTINPDTDLTEASNGFSFIGFMNKLQLGYIVNFITSIKTYIYGIVNVADVISAKYMENTALHAMLFVTLYILMTFIYILGAWMLITGRDIMGDN